MYLFEGGFPFELHVWIFLRGVFHLNYMYGTPPDLSMEINADLGGAAETWMHWQVVVPWIHCHHLMMVME